MQALKPLALTSLASFLFFWVVLDRGTSQGEDPESFQPIIEADLPAGFPAYTPVGKIEVKQYPRYRKAEADASGFWKLFAHIKKREIAMTAPVEMTCPAGDSGESRPANMAFLYGSPDTGSPGQQDQVDVVDVAPMTVISIGVRGARTEAAVAEAKEKLTDWLSERPKQYSEAGPLRIMAYNSPFVPRDKNFFEVQIPVRDRDS